MKNRFTNRLDMIGARITVANRPEYKPVWLGQDPADFETDLSTLTAGYAATNALAAQLSGASTGVADAKDLDETALEGTAYTLTRALANHFKKTGNLADRAKVNVSLSNIAQRRAQALVDFTTAIRNLGTAALPDPDAAKRGVTAARVTALTGAIALFDGLKNQPRGTIVNQSTLLREVETRIAGLMEENRDLDDLALQFDGTAAGLQFISAWKQAGIIVDAGHGPGPGYGIPTPVTPPTP